MKITKDMAPADLAMALAKLAEADAHSGPLGRLQDALEPYRHTGSALLDEAIGDFKAASVDFVRVVQRGHKGDDQWGHVTSAARSISVTLDYIATRENAT